jgi:hypothetical protein
MKPQSFTYTSNKLRGAKLRKELSQLTFKDGLMINVLKGQLPAYGNIVLAKNNKNKTVGWAVISKAKGTAGVNPIVMVYVKSINRGSGIAVKLVEEVLKEFKVLYKKKASIKNNKIPRAKKNLIYYDRIVELFFHPIRNIGFDPKLL